MAEDMERIARATISQALSDAGVGIATGKRVMVSALDRDEARAFLLSETGAWKQARELWCSLADLDPERLRRRTREVLKAPESPLESALIPEKPKCVPVKMGMRRRSAPMPGTKLADVLYYLRRPEGVAPEELMQKLKWKRETAISAISDLRMYGIRGKRCHDGRYRIASLP
jgi:hypothetical protein